MADTQVEQYDECSVIWDGALEEVVTVADGAILTVEYGGMDTREGDPLDAWLLRIENDANLTGCTVEITAVTHYHAPDFDGECECAQYSTDHRPIYTFGPDSDD